VDGDQALAFVRERYALGDGSDLGRIERQQAFLASVLQEATSAGTLTNPPKLYAFLSAATRSVTMDPDLARLQTLAGFAKQVTDVGLDKIQFVTVPTEEYPPDHNRLQWAPGASRVWRAVRQDLPISFVAPGTTGPSPSGTSPSTPSPSTPSPSTPSPSSSADDAGGGQVVVKGVESRTAAADICD
jgi:anionic cell wall polymer biosynthesis LytR-Cps2A-Psr (LCP) family protein